MSTTSSNRYDLEHDYPVWAEAFNKVTREHLVDDDLFAAKSVCGVLIAIVTGGAIFGVLTVTLCVLAGKI